MATVSLASGLSAVPSNVAVATTSNYISSSDLIASGTDTAGSFHKRDVDEQLIKRYGDQGITGLMELMGSKKETQNRVFEHYEETMLHNYFTADLDASGVLEIDDTSLDSGASTGNKNVRDGDIIMGGSGTLYYVTAITDSDTVVVKTLNGVLGTNDADTKFCVVGNAYAEATDQPGGITPRVHHYSNKCQIIKESFVVSGSEATNAVYVKVNSPESGSGYLWYLQGEADTHQRFLDYSELAMIVGQSSDGTLTNAADDTGTAGSATNIDTVHTTEGLLGFIENRGQTMDLGSSAITMADFDAAVKSLDKFRGAKEMALYAGINLSLDVDDLLASQGAYAAGGANYGTFANNKDMALNLGFNSFSRGGYTFHKKTYDLFNRPDLLGAASFKYNGFGMCIPMDSQRDAKSGEKIPSLRMRYKAANGYSREMEHWLTGGAVLQNKTNGEDKLQCNYRTERGFEGFAPNRFLLFKKS